MIVTPEITTIFITNTIIFLLATYTIKDAFQIILYYNRDATTPKQYKLEKRSYLIATVIRFLLLVKILLFFFFVYTLDILSSYLPGAMCAAGVVNATSYGVALLFLKIILIYFFSFWLVVHKEDMQNENQPYIRFKFILYCIIYFLILIELVLEGLMFIGIDTQSVVDCCGAIFSVNKSTYLSEILALPASVQVSIFYLLFFLMYLFFIIRNHFLFSITNLFFVIVSILSLISFFGTYIYEQPTHHCPFCMLQYDYNYIGYLLYTLLFLGTFYGMSIALLQFSASVKKRVFLKALFFNTFYVIVVTFYVISYYLHNGTWLK
jgi:hypothetical protein